MIEERERGWVPISGAFEMVACLYRRLQCHLVDVTSVNCIHTAQTHRHICTRTHARTHTHTHTHTHARAHTLACVPTHTHTCKCVHTHCTYTHAHAHTCTLHYTLHTCTNINTFQTQQLQPIMSQYVPLHATHTP